MSSHFEPGEPIGVMARRARNTTHYISSEDSSMESSSSIHVVIRTTRSVLQYKPHLV